MVTAKRKEWGFTLYELVIVIAIVAILMTIGIPNFTKNRANTKLRMAAKELYADLALAKSYAKAGGGNADFEYTQPKSASTGYTIKDPGGSTRKKVALSTGIVVDYSALDGNVITFSSNGACSTEGNVTISTGGTSKNFTISIVAETGALNIAENN